MADLIATSEARDILEFILKQAKFDANKSRKTDLKERKDLYEDDGKDILLKALKQQFSLETYDRINLLLDESINVIKRIVNEISIVYKEPAKRFLTKGQKQYEQILDDAHIDLTMASVNQYTNLMNHCGVLVSAKNKGIKYSIITPDMVDVYQDPDNPDEIQALAYLVSTPVTLGSNKSFWIYWDVFKRHKKFDLDLNEMPIEGNEEGINPYQDPDNPDRSIIPVAWFHRRKPEFQFWDQTSGKDFVNGGIQACIHLTYLNHMFKVTGFPQKYIAGNVDATGKQIMDPLTILKITSSSAENPQIGVLSNDFPMREYLDVVMEKISLLANNYGISKNNFRLTHDPSSGFALMLENAGKIENVKAQIPMYRQGERELFRITRAVNNFHDGKNLPDNADFSIDFAEPRFVENPIEQNQKWIERINAGVASKLDWIMELNPDLTEAEAKKLLEENLKANAQRANRFPELFDNGQNNPQPFGQTGQFEGPSEG